MRVVWLSHRDIKHPRSGGAERITFEVLKGLKREGFEVEWVAGSRGALPRSSEVEGIRVSRLPTAILAHAAAPLALWRQRDADVVVDDLGHAVPWFSPMWSSAQAVAMFYHLHARTLEGQVSRPAAALLRRIERLYPLIYHEQDFVTISQSSMNDLVALGVPRNRIRLIYPGVDTKLFIPGDRSPTPSLIYFGGMRDYKQPTHAVKALWILREGGIDATLAMVGDGPALPSVRRIVHETGLDSHVEFFGQLTHQELIGPLSKAWVNIHCALSEGWCLSALEAAAAGVPTAGYRIPGLVESVVDGRTGILVPPGDVQGLGRSVEQLLSVSSAWRTACREHALQFSWDRCITEWSNYLRNRYG